MALSASDTGKYPQAQAATDGSGNPLLVMIPTATGRLVTSAATENATVVKASAGRVFAIRVNNTNVAVRYLKLYDKATTPSEADIPRATIAMKASDVTYHDMHGAVFATGISFRMVTGAADNDDTAVGTDILGLNIDYA